MVDGESAWVRKKVILLGDLAVGKTSLARRYVYNIFDDKYISTIGVNVSKRIENVRYGDREYSVTMMVWDVFGEKGYQSTHRRFVEGADAGILVFDVTHPETFRSIWEYWIPLVSEVNAMGMVMIGNKIDLGMKIDEDEIAEHSKRYGIPYFLTSAKTGTGVEYAFHEAALLAISIGKVSMDRKGEGVHPSTRGILDHIMGDFIMGMEDVNEASLMFKEILERHNLKLGDSPTMAEMESIINDLYDIEKTMVGEDEAERKKNRRIAILNIYRRLKEGV